MIEWLVNATGGQIVTVILMLWLLIGAIELYVREKKNERD